MQATATVENVREILEKSEPGFAEVLEIRRQVYSSIKSREELDKLSRADLEERLSSEGKGSVRKAVIYWILGRLKEAWELFEQARPSREGLFFGAHCAMELGKSDEALRMLDRVAQFEAVRDSREDRFALGISRAKAVERLGAFQQGLEVLEKMVKEHGEEPEFLYHRGFCLEQLGFYAEAESFYQKVLAHDPEHQPTLFRLASTYDLTGNDARAEEIYDRLRRATPPHVNTLLHLGMLYEDKDDHDKAIECYQSVLDAYPNHDRARLYLKDAQSSLIQHYDEEAKRREAKWNRLLAAPLAEFPLSVRSRNCLARLRLQTLGDLVRMTEEDLLKVKNFGETSLREIKDLLASKGFTLAQKTGIVVLPEVKVAPAPPPPEQQEILGRPLSELEWSARAKKCLERLNLFTVGDLIQKTERDLLGCKNFGHTSLNEVKQKLSQFGLSLRRDKEGL